MLIIYMVIDKVQMTKGDVAFDITRANFICSSESTEIGEIKHTEPIVLYTFFICSFHKYSPLINIMLPCPYEKTIISIIFIVTYF